MTSTVRPPATRQRLAWVAAGLAGTLPEVAEIEEVFAPGFLEAVRPERIMAVFAAAANRDFSIETVDDLTPFSLRATTSVETVLDLEVEEEAPHRIVGLLLRAAEPEVVDDARLADPPMAIRGASGALVGELVDRFGSAGMVGVVAAGARSVPGHGSLEPCIEAAVGWADLESGRVASVADRFAAYSVTKLLTAVTVLRFVASGELSLETPVADVLTSYRLATRDVTVRELLTHTGGVSSTFEHWVDFVPETGDFLGPVLDCAGPRGTHAYSNGGYATLGQLIADVRGRPYADIVTDEILRPLEMVHSDFPTSAPWPATGVASGHVAEEGRIVGCRRVVPSVPSAGGLWTTAADLLRFAHGWAALLPDALVAEALTPQIERSAGGSVGLGFILGHIGEQPIWGHAGGGVGFQSSLLACPSAGAAAVAFVNRAVGAEPVAFRLLEEIVADVG